MELAVIAVSRQPVQQGLQVQAGDDLVGDDHRAFLRQSRRQQRAGPGQQVVADDHVVAGAGQHDMQAAGRFPLAAARS